MGVLHPTAKTLNSVSRSSLPIWVLHPDRFMLSPPRPHAHSSHQCPGLFAHVLPSVCNDISLLSPATLFLFFKAHSWHIKVPRLGVESELHLPAYTPAAATQDPSRICYLHHSSWQHWVLNPLSLARDRTHILMDTNRVCNPLSHKNSIISNSLIILKAQFK